MIIGGGIVCAVGAYIAENNGWTFAPGDVRFGSMENQLIFVPYICGGFSLITAAIGFVGLSHSSLSHHLYRSQTVFNSHKQEQNCKIKSVHS